MKLNKIASIFKRHKRLIIYTGDFDDQWISNGEGMYCMRGMPKMTTSIVLKIFDVPPDKHTSWLCEESEMPKAIDFSDYIDDELEIEAEKITFSYRGIDYWLFQSDDKVYSINAEYIKPLLDESDYLKFYKRETTGGGFVLVAKIGLEINAIIVPSMLQTDEEYVDMLCRISNLYRGMKNKAIAYAAQEIFISSTNETADADEDENDYDQEFFTVAENYR